MIVIWKAKLEDYLYRSLFQLTNYNDISLAFEDDVLSNQTSGDYIL